MRYDRCVPGIFLERLNRFTALVETEGETRTVHVKNTGRCQELFLPGASVTLQKAANPARRTGYDLISVYKSGLGWVNVDSQAPNAVVLEWLKTAPGLFDGLTLIRPETVYGKSRVDFYLERGSRRILMEVKGCTLEIGSVGFFPDAPTERGVKHLRELVKAAEEGYESWIAFVIAMPGIREVLPNRRTHPEFGEALDAATRGGVRVLNLACEVLPDELRIVSAAERTGDLPDKERSLQYGT